MRKFQIHVSFLLSMAMCGYRTYLEYIEGIRRPATTALAIGNVTHAAIAANLVRRKETGSLMSTEELESHAAAVLDRHWEKGVQLMPDERLLGEQHVKGEAKDKAVALSRLHHRDIAPYFIPTEVEQAFTLDMSPKLHEDWNLTRHIYQIAGTVDQAAGPKWLGDVKTSKRKPSDDVADRSIQLPTYALGIEKHEGARPKDGFLFYLVHGKNGFAKYIKRTVIDEESVQVFLRWLRESCKAIENEIFMPAAQIPGAWWCAPKFCVHHADCPFVRHPVMSKAITQDLGPVLIESIQQVKKTKKVKPADKKAAGITW
jgi:hypothetical protein